MPPFKQIYLDGIYKKKTVRLFSQLTASYRNIKTDQTEYIKIYFLIDFIYFVLELLLKK